MAGMHLGYHFCCGKICYLLSMLFQSDYYNWQKIICQKCSSIFTICSLADKLKYSIKLKVSLRLEKSVWIFLCRDLDLHNTLHFDKFSINIGAFGTWLLFICLIILWRLEKWYSNSKQNNKNSKIRSRLIQRSHWISTNSFEREKVKSID